MTLLRTFLATLFLVALTCSASAQFNSGGFGKPGFTSPASTGGGSPTWTNQVAAAKSGCGFVTTCPVSTTMTVPSGLIVAVAGADNQQGTGGSISGISVCGTNLTVDSSNSIPSGDTGIAIGHGTVTGGTCTVSVTSSVAGSINAAGIALGLLSNVSSSTPGTACGAQFTSNGTTSYPCTGGLTVISGGFGITGFFTNQPNLPTSAGSGLVVDASANIAGPAPPAIAIGHVTASFATGASVWTNPVACNCGSIGAPWD